MKRRTRTTCLAFTLGTLALLARGQNLTPLSPPPMVEQSAGQQSNLPELVLEQAVEQAVANNSSLKTASLDTLRAADDLAAMILADLSKIDGCPKRGVNVTVYGSNPWNSWLSFGGEAGPVPNKVELQGFCDIITERLKRLYDVAS